MHSGMILCFLFDELQCTPGYYCATTGLTEPEGLCSPGHYCSHGARTATPIDGITGGLCGGGHVSSIYELRLNVIP